jgi:hypothetical protein
MRKFFRQDTSYLIGPAYAFEVNQKMSLGVSVFAFMHSIKIIDNTVVLYDPVGSGQYFVYQANGSRTSLGTVIKAGMQYMPVPKVSIGVTAARPFNMAGSGKAQITSTQLDSSGNPVTPKGTFNTDMKTIEGSTFYEEPTPMSFSAGTAYFMSRTFLVTAQLDYHTAVQTFKEFPIRATLNWSLGSECYLTDSVAMRAGVYSNNARTQSVSASGTNQSPHVNLLGFSLGTGLYRSGTSLTLSLAYLSGTGQGQAFADTPVIQEVVQSQLALYIGGSYQL